jgi:predicted enzyme related to lactoylglutathione lyase
MPRSKKSSVYFECCNPILRVKNLKESVRFYVDLLGFKNAEWASDDFTCVSRDKAAIYLCEGDQGKGKAWVWVGVDDARKLNIQLAANGVKIKQTLTNFPWALEFHAEDPDGNVLRFGSEPE